MRPFSKPQESLMVEKQGNIASSTIAAERAIDELRRQQGIIITENDAHAIANYPAEFLTEAQFASWNSAGAQLLISAPRAKMLGLGDTAVKLSTTGLTLAQVQALADPTADQSQLPKTKTTPATAIDAMALTLAKYASLLPALLLIPAPLPTTIVWASLNASDLAHYIAHPELDIIQTASAQLPLSGAENTRIVSFRSAHATAVHLALIIGEPGKAAPLTRIHSSCVTGDILGSLRCDCGDQLKLAMEQISAHGSGILVYLHQEGRGIGITNKLRAYALQERGMDTFDANLALGFEEDERNFAIAAAILKKLGFPAIRMLTNNPQKMAALQTAGITVSERVPLVVATGRHNHSYLEAKAKKSGHLL